MERRGFLRLLCSLGAALLAGCLKVERVEELSPAKEGPSDGEPGQTPSLPTTPEARIEGPLVEEPPVAGLREWRTPNDRFFTVSKNLIDPSVELGDWSLTIGGMVERPATYSYLDLAALQAVREIVTLECISNEVGGDLIGNAEWEGVRLRDILAAAGVKAGARDVILRGMDEYSDSIPVERAMRGEVLLALRMNGELLPKGHGFPLRAIVPGIYGMKNVKWVRSIEVVGEDYLGYWQKRGWSDAAVVRTTSVIDTPPDGATVALGEVPVAGMAFAGDRGVARVEVSADGGVTWGEARLEKAGKYTWALWSYRWNPLAEGDHTLWVRAWDSEGKVQTELPAPPLPAGAAGYHAVKINVRR